MFPVVKSSVNNFLDESEKLLAEGKNAKEILKSGLKAGKKRWTHNCKVFIS